MTRKTVGKISAELKQKELDNTHSAEEQMREQLSEYDKNIAQAITDGLKKYPHDFYIIVLTKKERLMQNVIRNYFFTRLSCPTPEWDQVVYFYDRKANEVQFMWVIPDKETCQLLKDNALLVDPVEKKLLEYVLSFYDGTLFRWAKKLNGEQEDSPILA